MSDCQLRVVASECSRNHFISENYKAVQSFKLSFLQNSARVQLSTLLPETVKVLETFLEAILLKPFQFSRRILNDASSITIALYLPS
jgi:hypothetical protein